MNGFLNLLKPPGMTSSDAVVCVRKTLSGEKTGHAGTLDPEAAGVLPIMIGKASRLFDVLVEKEKAYIAEIAFGVWTDTQDAQGKTIGQSEARPDEADICAVLPRFVGDIMQTPPAFSALKVGGQSAYALARRGNLPKLHARPARVNEIELLEMTGENSALLRVACGKGVYVRTLCHDIGQALGCGAHMRFLLRTRSGSFLLEDSVTLEDWMAADDRAALLAPMDAPLGHLPLARVPQQDRTACRNGKPLTCFDEIDSAAREDGPVRVYCGQTFAGIACWRADEKALRFSAMLLEE